MKSESSHFESFKTVFWEENTMNRLLRNTLNEMVTRYTIPREAVPHLFLLALVLTAHLKYDSLMQSRGLTGDRDPNEHVSDEERLAAWKALGDPDKDVPFACLHNRACLNVRHVATRGFPELL
ncbi:MAG: hypothetical protein AAF492_33480, partial [Verrucomicrobiota bacterium]